MHASSKAQLQAIRLRAMALPPGFGRARAFLSLLGPIHDNWHSTVTVHGFLLFHWQVIRHFRAVGGPALFGGISPFTTAQFANRYNAPYNINIPVTPGNTQALAAFSAAVEDWHNGAHMRIEMRDGVNMMDPRTNIFVRQFWRLHYFINARFEEQLRSFDPPGTPASGVVARIESNNHNMVPLI